MFEKKKIPKTLIFLIFLSFLIFVFDRLGWLNFAKSFLENNLVIPVGSKFRPPAEVALNVCLEKETEVIGLKAQVSNLKQELAAVKKLLGTPLPPDWRFLPAKVISGNEDEIIIGLGEKSGVEKGMMVVFENLFLGKVFSLSQNLSKVKFLSALDSKEAVKIVDQETLILTGKGLLGGLGEGKMEVKEILAQEEVKSGDLVTIPFWDFDLAVGQVSQVDYKKGEVFKTAKIYRPLTIRQLETVFLVVGRI